VLVGNLRSGLLVYPVNGRKERGETSEKDESGK
jgi:hypothetical protein